MNDLHTKHFRGFSFEEEALAGTASVASSACCLFVGETTLFLTSSVEITPPAERRAIELEQHRRLGFLR